MKNTKANIALFLASTLIFGCIILEAIKTRMDRILRYSAGESLYEKTHTKKRK